MRVFASSRTAFASRTRRSVDITFERADRGATRARMFALNLRARTRNTAPRHARSDDRSVFDRAASSARSNDGASASTSEQSAPAERKRLLGEALRRLDCRLLGAPWCEKCRQQKELLAELLPGRWKRHYVDCGSASRCLACVSCKTTPTWRVNGRRYPGVFDLHTLTELVGLQREGSRQAVEDRVIDAVDAGDPLGGLRLGDLKVRGRDRRHARRGGWAKRAAVRLAAREQGRFWCEFGELLTPNVAARARAAANGGEPLRPM